MERALDWLRQAAKDLQHAKNTLKNQEFEWVCFAAQQSAEKALKAILIEKEIKLKRTHDILEIKYLLQNNSVKINISDDECDFLNSIYIPSKYPLGSLLADYNPDEKICQSAIKIAEKVLQSVNQFLN